MSANFFGGVVGVVALAAILSFKGCDGPATPVQTPVEVKIPPPTPEHVKKRKPQVSVTKKIPPRRKISVPKSAVIDCSKVPDIAHQYPRDQVVREAAKMLTPKQMTSFQKCL